MKRDLLKSTRRKLGVAALGAAALMVSYALGWIRPPVLDPPSPSSSAEALIWSPARMELDWPLPVRAERPGPPVLVNPARASGTPPSNFIDASGDVDPSASWVDLTSLFVPAGFSDDPQSVSEVMFDLATEPLFMPHAQERWVAYGMVVDLDGDGVGDLRLGMDNIGYGRAWRTDLETGATVATLRPPMGVDPFMDIRMPDQGRARLRFIAADMGEFRWYVWASMIDDGREIATDYAPDAGWFDPRPSGHQLPAE